MYKVVSLVEFQVSVHLAVQPEGWLALCLVTCAVLFNILLFYSLLSFSIETLYNRW